MDKSLLRVLVIVVFGFLFGMHFGVSAVAAERALVFRSEALSILLEHKPCTNAKVLRFIEASKRSMYRVAAIVWAGRPLQGCWAEVPEGVGPEPVFFVVDETGDAGLMPRSVFAPDDGKGIVRGVGV